jgi:hypothetical protein
MKFKSLYSFLITHKKKYVKPENKIISQSHQTCSSISALLLDYNLCTRHPASRSCWTRQDQLRARSALRACYPFELRTKTDCCSRTTEYTTPPQPVKSVPCVGTQKGEVRMNETLRFFMIKPSALQRL